VATSRNVSKVPSDPAIEDLQAAEAVSAFAPDADIEAMLVYFNLIRAADRVQQDFEVSVQRPAGLTWAAFRALFALRTLGPATPLQLSLLNSVSQASISSILKTLSAKALIRREPSTSDGRSVIVHLTAEGLAVVDELFRRNNLREAQWAQALTPAEKGILILLTRKIRAYSIPKAESLEQPVLGSPHERVAGEADAAKPREPRPAGNAHSGSKSARALNAGDGDRDQLGRDS
jgi:DNA-binding MarR family transcriptional regulator